MNNDDINKALESFLDERHPETKGELAGKEIPIEVVARIVEYCDKAVILALHEILQTAKEMDSDVVPVKFLEFLLDQPSTAGRLLLASVQHTGISLTADVPDDISGLEGL